MTIFGLLTSIGLIKTVWSTTNVPSKFLQGCAGKWRHARKTMIQHFSERHLWMLTTLLHVFLQYANLDVLHIMPMKILFKLHYINYVRKCYTDMIYKNCKQNKCSLKFRANKLFKLCYSFIVGFPRLPLWVVQCLQTSSRSSVSWWKIEFYAHQIVQNDFPVACF